MALTNAPAWDTGPARADAPKDRGRLAAPPADTSFEAAILADIAARADAGEGVEISHAVTPRDRSIGARLAGHLARRPEPRRMPRVRYLLRGSAGQSLGAFAVPGMRIVVEGEANDYVGKGLSGGTVVVRPDRSSDRHKASDQAIVGNVCLYGATGGTLHVVGRGGMRFAVRNAGARAVVEGIGAHGCEYMTGGAVVVLGDIGPNFGAGMTGGRAFLAAETAGSCLNAESVVGRPLDAEDERLLLELLAAHAREGSAVASDILGAWDPRRFVTVVPLGVANAVAADDVVEVLAIAR
ncbi:MAG: hypothetical protein ACHQ02_01950 [Candidatus Limnocylindrales bacterium]